MPAFLIDTDWVIDHLNGVAARTRRLQELQAQGLAVSIVSVAELWEGVHFSKDPIRSRAQLKRFLEGLSVLGLDDETCSRFGQLGAGVICARSSTNPLAHSHSRKGGNPNDATTAGFAANYGVEAISWATLTSSSRRPRFRTVSRC